jgi:hypothetical protein
MYLSAMVRPQPAQIVSRRPDSVFTETDGSAGTDQRRTFLLAMVKLIADEIFGRAILRDLKTDKEGKGEDIMQRVNAKFNVSTF